MEQDATPEKSAPDATDKTAEPEISEVKENGPNEAAVDEQSKEKEDAAEDEILAEKVEDMLADNEGDDLIDLDKDGLLDDVSPQEFYHFVIKDFTLEKL